MGLMLRVSESHAVDLGAEVSQERDQEVDVVSVPRVADPVEGDGPFGGHPVVDGA